MAARALGNQMSRTVRVDRKRLIETLTKNREAHIKQFDEAMAGYKAAALKEIQKAFDGLETRLKKRQAEMIEHVNSFTVETAKDFNSRFTVLEAVTVNLEVPVSYADAYDAAIDMANFDVREELELSGAEFQCFCRDVWDWTYEFSNITKTYGGSQK